MQSGTQCQVEKVGMNHPLYEVVLILSVLLLNVFLSDKEVKKLWTALDININLYLVCCAFTTTPNRTTALLCCDTFYLVEKDTRILLRWMCLFILVVYLATPSRLYSVASKKRMIMNNQLEWIWKEGAVA